MARKRERERDSWRKIYICREITRELEKDRVRER
jgi:hypothetical protein